MLRTIIVDDEELSVKWLKNVLTECGEVEISHTFMKPLDAFEYVKANPIDVAFLDISMPEINGMRLSGLLNELDASIDVVFVTAYDDYAVRAFELSALDYLMKPVTAERLSITLDKIRKKYRSEAGGIWKETDRRELVSRRLRFIEGGVEKQIAPGDPGGSYDIKRTDALSPTAGASVEPLTNREAEMLKALANGFSNKEIADRFGITESTVKSHVFRLYGKLGVKRRSQAIAMAMELKLIE